MSQVAPPLPPLPVPPSPEVALPPGGPKATGRSQVAAFAVVAAALVITAVAAGVGEWGIGAVLSLGSGVAVGLATGVSARFGRMPGAVLALVVGVALAAGIGVLAASTGVLLPWSLVPVVCLVVVGLDWERVDGLRVDVLASAVVVVLAALSTSGWVYPVVGVWLLGAFGALAVLEADRRAGQPRARILGDPSARVAGVDAASTAVTALVIAVLLALVLAAPSCRRQLDGEGQRQQGQEQGQRDGQGAGEGRGGGGGSGSGSGAGAEGGSGSGSPQDHRYVPDPDGRFLVPDGPSGGGAGGSGGGAPRIPDPAALPDLEPGASTTERYADGSEVTFERLADGDIQATVEGPGGFEGRYRYHERADGLTQIDRYDEDGNLLDTYFYDPDGTVAAGGSSSSSGGTVPEREDPEQEPEREPVNWWPLIIGALVVALLVALAWWWWRRMRRPAPPEVAAPPWAVELARRLDHEGAIRGRPRARDESVVAYGGALRGSVLPDDRLDQLAAHLSEALFSRRDPGPDVERWCRSALEEVLAAHPRPSRIERRKRPASVGS